MVPKMLTQKEIRMTRADEFIDMADAYPVFYKTIVSGDKPWSFLYDSQTKR